MSVCVLSLIPSVALWYIDAGMGREVHALPQLQCQEVQHTTLCGGGFVLSTYLVRWDSELLLPPLPFLPNLPIPSLSPSSLLSPISLPFLPSLPPTSTAFSSPPSNQLTVHTHLPIPIRIGIGNHYTNTHCNFITPPHTSTNQLHRSLHATSHRLQVCITVGWS